MALNSGKPDLKDSSSSHFSGLSQMANIGKIIGMVVLGSAALFAIIMVLTWAMIEGPLDCYHC